MPLILQFFNVILLAPSEIVLANQTTAEFISGLIFVIVRFLDVLPLLEPSMITLSAPFSLISPVGVLPVKVALTPVFGLIVSV